MLTNDGGLGVLIVSGVSVALVLALVRIALTESAMTVTTYRRRLLAAGWNESWIDASRPMLDKCGIEITLTCISADPATRGAVLTAIDFEVPSGRHLVVIAPGSVEDNLADEILERWHVSVISYLQISNFDSVLHAHLDRLACYRAREKHLFTESLDAPVPASLVPMPSAHEGASDFNSPIFQTEHVQVYFRDEGSDRLIIAFNDSWRHGAGGRLHPGLNVTEFGYSVLDCVTCEPNWFPTNDMVTLLPMILDRLAGRFSRRITLGFSQGGYAAIKFSKVLGATATVAFSPQYSIDPIIMKENRFEDQFRRHLNVGMAIRAGDCLCPAFVFFDPYDRNDSEHVERVSQEVALHRLRAPFFGHRTSQLFDSPLQLETILASCEREDLAGLRAVVSECRHKNQERSYLICMHAVETNPERALKIANARWATWTDSQKPHIAYRLASRGHAGSMLPLMERLAAARADDHECQGGAALVAILARRPAEAMAYAERAISLKPLPKWRHAKLLALELQAELAMIERPVGGAWPPWDS